MGMDMGWVRRGGNNVIDLLFFFSKPVVLFYDYKIHGVINDLSQIKFIFIGIYFLYFFFMLI
jgi:hypothetical protein